MNDIMHYTDTLTYIVLLLALHLSNSSLPLTEKMTLSGTEDQVLQDSTRYDSTPYQHSKISSRRTLQSPTYRGANGLNFISDITRAIAYQAHVCSWSCLRDNFTQQLPDKIVQSATLRVSCIDCSCDKDCVIYGDCCGSFDGAKTSHKEDTNKTPSRPTYECLSINEHDGVFVVSSCPKDDQHKRIKRVKKISKSSAGNVNALNHPADVKDGKTIADVNSVIQKCHTCLQDSANPITVANKTYCNKFCLQCHEGRSVQTTDVIWRSHKTDAYHKPPNAVVRACDARYKSIRSFGYCSVDRAAVNLTTEMEEQFDLFRSLCESFRAPVIYNETLYNNIFCCLCSIVTASNKHKVSLALLTDLSGLSRSLRSPGPRYRSHGDQIDQSGGGGHEEGDGDLPDGQCRFGYRRFHDQGACHKILCESGRSLSLDNHSSEWTCTPAEHGRIQGFRLRAVWRVVSSPSPGPAVDTGQTKRGIKLAASDNGEDHVTGRDSQGLIDNIDEKRLESDKLDLLKWERFNGSGRQMSRELSVAAHVTSDGIYDHLITLIRHSVCRSLAARNVTRFCIRACRGQSYGEYVEGHGCIYMKDGAVVDLESFIKKDTPRQEKNSFQQLQDKEKEVIPSPWKHEEATDRGVTKDKSATRGRQAKKNKHAKSIRETSAQGPVIERTVSYVTVDLLVIAEPNYGIENLLVTDFLGVKRFEAVNYSLDVEVALVSADQKDSTLQACSRDSQSSEKMDDRFVQLTTVSACAHVRLNFSEVNFIGDGEVIVEGSDVTLYRYQYFNDTDDTILVCAKTLDEAISSRAIPLRADTTTLLSRVETILTIVSLSVSFVCLFITLTTYCAIPALRSMPGKNNMILVTSLIVAQFMLIAADFPEPDTLVCTVVGVVLHYSWLSTIIWMSACSFHMFHVFVIHQATPSNGRSHWSYLVRYLAVTHSVSAVIVLAVVIPSLYWSSGKTPGYGIHVCYLDTTLLVALGFVLPLSVVVVTNVGFFGVTVYTISRLENVKKHTKREQKNVHVYLRLSALTGISWALALIAEIPGVEFLRCVSIIVNGSQGLLIFLSYICNQRALTLWKHVFSKAGAESRSSRNITSTTSI
ncbi:hypothetical protein Btru_060914 [Bulinus truncatus]|nr:hypothetical protein Btru_060914 [Bulinus truncatus]